MKKLEILEPQYTFSEKTQLLEWARIGIENYLKDRWIIQTMTNNQMLKRKVGVFVTLWKQNQLRGCMGIIQTDKPLNESVVEIAIEAATKDLRFPPVNLSELTEIKLELSILSSLKKIKNIKDIELGKHGVMIVQNKKSGVFLPEVPLKEGWNPGTFLEALCVEKAGLQANAWMDKNTDLYVFTTVKIKEE